MAAKAMQLQLHLGTTDRLSHNIPSTKLMKTKFDRSQRKHSRHTTRQQQALAARKRAGMPKRVPPQPRTQVSAVVRPSMEMVQAYAEACNDGMNLVRSVLSDDEGNYLIMSIEVPVPFTVAYDAWTRFEQIPHFMRGGDLSASRDGSRMTWRIHTRFDQFAWQAKVCEQVPYDLIVWKSVQGTPHPGFGCVSFEPISHLRTWIMVQVGFDMSGVFRWLGDPLPSLSQSMEQSLKRFHGSMAVAQFAQALENQPTFLATAAA